MFSYLLGLLHFRGGVSYTVGGTAAPPTSDLPHQLFQVLIGFDLKMSVFISSETRNQSFETRRNPLQPEILDK